MLSHILFCHFYFYLFGATIDTFKELCYMLLYWNKEYQADWVWQSMRMILCHTVVRQYENTINIGRFLLSVLPLIYIYLPTSIVHVSSSICCFPFFGGRIIVWRTIWPIHIGTYFWGSFLDLMLLLWCLAGVCSWWGSIVIEGWDRLFFWPRLLLNTYGFNW